MPVTQEMQSLGEVLARRTVEGDLYVKLEKNAVQCFSCGHRCRIPEGLKGICKVRYNEGGVLQVPRGYAAAL
ncbi:MAG TPA: AmmeMemoRadiSam system radical SAM enzyme, partial [Thermoanaerobaculia bacterium]|nr:AmmeMemoRadiSam system radical SAM enzyme [Thermoanaerobaculia bacterium]